MTRFKNILRRTYRDDEKITLMKLGLSEQKDELGKKKKKYIPIQELHGIIQGDQDLDIDDSGQESHPGYIAYLMPEFNLERESLNDFRIKYFLRHKRHHITLILLLEKKYNG